MEPLLTVRGLKTEYITERGTVHAVDGVDFEIGKGEVLGVVGESGCGKSVTALSVMYLIPQPPGRIVAGQVWLGSSNLLAGSDQEIRIRPRAKGKPRIIRNDVLLKRHRARANKIRGRDISMIFQEPMSSLNPVLPVGYQVAEVLMYQRRREICDGLLSRRALTKEDYALFERAAATADPAARDQLISDFCVATGTDVDRVKAIIETSGLAMAERKDHLTRLARRRRVGSRWFLEFLKRLDTAEEAHYRREWRLLSRPTMGIPATALFDPSKNPGAGGLPRLVRIAPKEDRLELRFNEKPTEDLRARVEVLLRESIGKPDWMMFHIVSRVAKSAESIDLVYRKPPTAQDMAQALTKLLSPSTNPSARDIPSLLKISPGDERTTLTFQAKPSEGLRDRVEQLVQAQAAADETSVLGLITEVVLRDDSLELTYPPLESSELRLEAEYRSRWFVYRTILAIPFLRTRLMKPVEAEARRRVLELLKLVRIPEPTKIYNEYPHELSGGMQQRVMIAMALACDPSLMIADEPTTALDVTTQAQILKLMKDLRARVNSAILYITHDLAVVAEISDRIAVMYAGKIAEDASVDELFANPMHPYTQGLLESIVSMDSQKVEQGKGLPTIPGTVPDLRNPPTGCRFHPRCKFAWERCRQEEPQLVPRATGHKVACHLYDPKEGDRGRPG